MLRAETKFDDTGKYNKNGGHFVTYEYSRHLSIINGRSHTRSSSSTTSKRQAEDATGGCFLLKDSQWNISLFLFRAFFMNSTISWVVFIYVDHQSYLGMAMKVIIVFGHFMSPGPVWWEIVWLEDVWLVAGNYLTGAIKLPLSTFADAVMGILFRS